MAKQYVVNGERTSDIRLRQSPDRSDPKYEEWFVWQAGEVFTPPAHMNVEKALARGVILPVSSGRRASGAGVAAEAGPMTPPPVSAPPVTSPPAPLPWRERGVEEAGDG